MTALNMARVKRGLRQMSGGAPLVYPPVALQALPAKPAAAPYRLTDPAHQDASPADTPTADGATAHLWAMARAKPPHGPKYKYYYTKNTDVPDPDREPGDR